MILAPPDAMGVTSGGASQRLRKGPPGAKLLAKSNAGGQAKGDGNMSTQERAECCAKFEPGPWDDKVVTWEGKQFLKARVRSFFHIPLNFAAVMKRSMATIEAAGAAPDEMVILSDENSLWGADVYVAIGKDIPGAKTSTLSGTFLTKVFEGPFQNLRNWIQEMKSFVKDKGKAFHKLLFFYTTCPKCAKKYGKNYVVILAQVQG
jgi:hypothetical protein